MRSSETTVTDRNAEDPWQPLAEEIVQRCSPLNFDPAALREFLQAQPAMQHLDQRDALGECVARLVVGGGMVSPHAARELAQLFGWQQASERSGEDSVLRHPVLLQLLQQRAAPQRRAVELSGRAQRKENRELAPWVVSSLGVGFFAYHWRNTSAHLVFEPSLWRSWSPLLLAACVALMCIMEFWMMRYDPRSLSAPLTPGLQRAHWIGRGVLGVLGVAAAAGTARLL